MIEITISGVHNTPRWETLQNVLREARGEPQGLFTRIARVDNGCYYRGTGDYELTWITPSEEVQVKLRVSL